MEHFFISVGFGNVVNASRILSIGIPDSAPVKRDMAEFRSAGRLIDYTKGRRTRALIYLDNGLAVASNMLPETLATRFVGRSSAASNAGKKDA